MKYLTDLIQKHPIQLAMGFAVGIALYVFLNGVYTGVRSALEQ